MNTRAFKVNGQNLPSPDDGWSWEYEDICDEDTGRNLSATMDKNIIASKSKLSLNWTNIPDSISSRLLSRVKGQTFVSFTFPDAYSGADKTIMVYTNNPKATLKRMINNVCYWDVEINFIEQ